jgi:Polyketide cyclase / dehydrase and lipid transport
MPTLITRTFVVDVPLETAWHHLARVEAWPSWAKHIKAVELTPPGEAVPQSQGVLHLRNGLTTRFQMREFRPFDHWKWVGPLLWLTIFYDHIFTAITSQQTQLTFLVAVEGWGVPLFGRLFAAVYKRNLDTAIPYLITELNTLKQ